MLALRRGSASAAAATAPTAAVGARTRASQRLARVLPLTTPVTSLTAEATRAARHTQALADSATVATGSKDAFAHGLAAAQQQQQQQQPRRGYSTSAVLSGRRKQHRSHAELADAEAHQQQQHQQRQAATKVNAAAAAAAGVDATAPAPEPDSAQPVGSRRSRGRPSRTDAQRDAQSAHEFLQSIDAAADALAAEQAAAAAATGGATNRRARRARVRRAAEEKDEDDDDMDAAGPQRRLRTRVSSAAEATTDRAAAAAVEAPYIEDFEPQQPGRRSRHAADLPPPPVWTDAATAAQAAAAAEPGTGRRSAVSVLPKVHEERRRRANLHDEERQAVAKKRAEIIALAESMGLSVGAATGAPQPATTAAAASAPKPKAQFKNTAAAASETDATPSVADKPRAALWAAEADDEPAPGDDLKAMQGKTITIDFINELIARADEKRAQQDDATLAAEDQRTADEDDAAAAARAPAPPSAMELRLEAAAQRVLAKHAERERERDVQLDVQLHMRAVRVREAVSLMLNTTNKVLGDLATRDLQALLFTSHKQRNDLPVPPGMTRLQVILASMELRDWDGVVAALLRFRHVNRATEAVEKLMELIDARSAREYKELCDWKYGRVRAWQQRLEAVRGKPKYHRLHRVGDVAYRAERDVRDVDFMRQENARRQIATRLYERLVTAHADAGNVDGVLVLTKEFQARATAPLRSPRELPGPIISQPPSASSPTPPPHKLLAGSGTLTEKMASALVVAKRVADARPPAAPANPAATESPADSKQSRSPPPSPRHAALKLSGALLEAFRLKPDAAEYTAALQETVRYRNLRMIHNAYRSMIERNVPVSLADYNTMIRACAQVGNVSRMCYFFNQLHARWRGFARDIGEISRSDLYRADRAQRRRPITADNTPVPLPPLNRAFEPDTDTFRALIRGFRAAKDFAALHNLLVALNGRMELIPLPTKPQRDDTQKGGSGAPLTDGELQHTNQALYMYETKARIMATAWDVMTLVRRRRDALSDAAAAAVGAVLPDAAAAATSAAADKTGQTAQQQQQQRPHQLPDSDQQVPLLPRATRLTAEDVDARWLRNGILAATELGYHSYAMVYYHRLRDLGLENKLEPWAYTALLDSAGAIDPNTTAADWRPQRIWRLMCERRDAAAAAVAAAAKSDAEGGASTIVKPYEFRLQDWHAYLRALVRRRDVPDAYRTFQYMRRQGMPIDNRVLSALIDAFGAAGDLSSLFELVESMRSNTVTHMLPISPTAGLTALPAGQEAPLAITATSASATASANSSVPSTAPAVVEQKQTFVAPVHMPLSLDRGAYHAMIRAFIKTASAQRMDGATGDRPAISITQKARLMDAIWELYEQMKTAATLRRTQSAEREIQQTSERLALAASAEAPKLLAAPAGAAEGCKMRHRLPVPAASGDNALLLFDDFVDPLAPSRTRDRVVQTSAGPVTLPHVPKELMHADATTRAVDVASKVLTQPDLTPNQATYELMIKACGVTGQNATGQLHRVRLLWSDMNGSSGTVDPIVASAGAEEIPLPVSSTSSTGTAASAPQSSLLPGVKPNMQHYYEYVVALFKHKKYTEGIKMFWELQKHAQQRLAEQRRLQLLQDAKWDEKGLPAPLSPEAAAAAAAPLTYDARTVNWRELLIPSVVHVFSLAGFFKNLNGPAGDAAKDLRKTCLDLLGLPPDTTYISQFGAVTRLAADQPLLDAANRMCQLGYDALAPYEPGASGQPWDVPLNVLGRETAAMVGDDMPSAGAAVAAGRAPPLGVGGGEDQARRMHRIRETVRRGSAPQHPLARVVSENKAQALSAKPSYAPTAFVAGPQRHAQWHEKPFTQRDMTEARLGKLSGSDAKPRGRGDRNGDRDGALPKTNGKRSERRAEQQRMPQMRRFGADAVPVSRASNPNETPSRPDMEAFAHQQQRKGKKNRKD